MEYRRNKDLILRAAFIWHLNYFNLDTPIHIYILHIHLIQCTFTYMYIPYLEEYGALALHVLIKL